jgi:hypothetical protein
MAATVVAETVLANPLHAAAWSGASQRGTVGAAQGAAGARHDLAKLAADHFEPLIGQTFTVGGNPVTLRNVHRGRTTRAQFRQQFAIVFDAPQNLSIRSETLPVSHPAVGGHDLLVTQVMDGLDRTALEICFG